MVINPYDGFDAEKYLTDVLGATNVTHNNDELVHRCLLPFGLHRHGDTTGKASLNVEKLLYNCWVCGGGNLLWATQEILQVSSGEARRIIEQNVIPSGQSAQQFRDELEKRWGTMSHGKPIIPKYSKAMLEPWKCYAKYLDERNVSHEVQQQMQTGINELNVDRYHDEWVTQPRLVIPHIFNDVLVGWSMRLIDDRQIGPKYKHTPSMPKDITLYNWDNVQDTNEVIVVESPLSVLRLMSEGFNNAVATFGVSITDNQIELLKTFDKIIWFPDGDSAGYGALVDAGKKPGMISKLMDKDLWIIDHGIQKVDGNLMYNRKDAADYSADEIGEFMQDLTPAYLWDWRKDELQKVG